MIQAAIKSILTADATLSTLTAGRIYPTIAPQSTAYPSVWYDTDQVRRMNSRDAKYAFQGMFEVGVIAPAYELVPPTIAAIKNALEDYAGTTAGVNLTIYSSEETPASFDEKLKLHEKSIQFKVIGNTVTG